MVLIVWIAVTSAETQPNTARTDGPEWHKKLPPPEANQLPHRTDARCKSQSDTCQLYHVGFRYVKLAINVVRNTETHIYIHSQNIPSVPRRSGSTKTWTHKRTQRKGHILMLTKRSARMECKSRWVWKGRAPLGMMRSPLRGQCQGQGTCRMSYCAPSMVANIAAYTNISLYHRQFPPHSRLDRCALAYSGRMVWGVCVRVWSFFAFLVSHPMLGFTQRHTFMG